MSAPHVVAVNATLPGYTAEVRDADTGALVVFPPGTTFRYRRRPISGTQDVDKAATNPSPGVLAYGPYAAGETATPGLYAEWFFVDFGAGSTQETPETLLEITDHVSEPATGTAGPCTPWVTADDVDDMCGCSDLEFTLAARAASEVLYRLSGRRFAGLCTAVVRPCRTGCGCEWGDWPRYWGWWGSAGGWPGWGWFGLPGSSCPAPCGCGHVPTIRLAGYPVRAITSVTIDGDVVDPATYRLDRNRELVRLADGTTNPPTARVWPSCQNLAVGPTAPGSFTITYTYGKAPPDSGRLAAAELACEIGKQIKGGECKLPSRATRVTRQGITIDRTVTGEWLKAKTGMPLVDMFLSSVNPHGLQRRPAVWSPETPRYPRRV